MLRLSIRVLLAAASVTTSVRAADPADPALHTRPLDHRSVFDTYRAGSAAAVGDWRDANDAVGRQTGGHMHDHGSPAAVSPDPQAGHDHRSPPAADPHAAHGAMKPDHGQVCQHDSKEGGDAHKH